MIPGSCPDERAGLVKFAQERISGIGADRCMEIGAGAGIEVDIRAEEVSDDINVVEVRQSRLPSPERRLRCPT